MSVTPPENKNKTPNTPSKPPTSIQQGQQISRHAEAALASLGWSREAIEVIRATLAPGAKPEELFMFLYLAKEYGLDPFKREIYFTRDRNNRPIILTGIDGFRKVARRNPAYEGVIAQAVREGDEFAFDPANYTVVHRFGQQRGKVIGAWARADAKGRKPALVWVDFDEYKRPGWDSWEKMPATMIAKVAEAQAIRRQFGLGGLYTDDEIPPVPTGTPSAVEVEDEPEAHIDAGVVLASENAPEFATDEGDATPPEPAPSTPAPAPAPQAVEQPIQSAPAPQSSSPPAADAATPAQRNFLRGLFDRKFPGQNLEEWLQQKAGGGLEQLTRTQASDLIQRLKLLPDAAKPGKQVLDVQVAGPPEQRDNGNGYKYLIVPCLDTSGNLLDAYMHESQLPVSRHCCAPGLRLRLTARERRENALLVERVELVGR